MLFLTQIPIRLVGTKIKQVKQIPIRLVGTKIIKQVKQISIRLVGTKDMNQTGECEEGDATENLLPGPKKNLIASVIFCEKTLLQQNTP